MSIEKLEPSPINSQHDKQLEEYMSSFNNTPKLKVSANLSYSNLSETKVMTKHMTSHERVILD